jgi:oxygen-independent coproporphyrinogen-3 oxidase
VHEAGLYVHIPFCSSVCPYCDFAVLIAGRERQRGYLRSLLAEIELHRSWTESIDTIYFGGGTPSTLQPEQLAEIIDTLKELLPIAEEPWVFLEANPEDVGRQTVREWKTLGIRTVSLGVQSTNPRALRYLGRRHDREQAMNSVLMAREAGFQTVSVDLIYGFEGQNSSAWRDELDTIVTLKPDHLSCYQLTFHGDTLFGRRLARGQLAETPEGRQAELFFLTHTFLEDAGYAGYEVSSFATAPRHHSQHNLKYWNHTPYLGLGPSAHSFAGTRRWWNIRKLRLWAAAIAEHRLPIEDEERLTNKDLALEAVMLGLRTHAGIDLQRIRNSHGVDLLETNSGLIARLCHQGLLTRREQHLMPTLSGLAVADTLARQIDI